MILLLAVFAISHASLQSEILSTHDNCKELHKHFTGETLGYTTSWNPLGSEFALKYSTKFTYVSPVWHEISFYYSAGLVEFSVSGDVDSDFVKDSVGKFKLVPRILITRTHPRAYIALLESDGNIARLCTSLIAFARQNHYQGLVLEFWLQGLSIIFNLKEAEEYRSLQVRMLKRVGKALQSAGLIAITTVPPMRGAEISSREFLAILDDFDKVNVMTYDFSPEKPGPNSPVPWILQTFEDLTQGNEVDTSKILLGVPFYGYEYSDERGKSVVGKEFIDILRGKVTDVWDAEGKEHRFVYNRGGKLCEVYYPTIEMLKERIKLAEKFKMGVAIWELGQGLEHFFELF